MLTHLAVILVSGGWKPQATLPNGLSSKRLSILPAGLPDEGAEGISQTICTSSGTPYPSSSRTTLELLTVSKVWIKDLIR